MLMTMMDCMGCIVCSVSIKKSVDARRTCCQAGIWYGLNVRGFAALQAIRVMLTPPTGQNESAGLNADKHENSSRSVEHSGNVK